MAEPPPTRLHIDPPMHTWQVVPRNGRTTPVIATGHQPTLWHPGILAKYLAADASAKHVGGSTLNIVVEHNPVEPLTLEFPTQNGNELGTQSLALGSVSEAKIRPPNRLPPIEPTRIHRAITEAARDAIQPVRPGLDRIAQAFAQQGDQPNAADQTSAVLAELIGPYLHDAMPARSASGLVTQRFVDRLLDDPVGCVRAYNRAAMAYPDAGVRPLYAGREAVEAPLWAQHTASSTPVFIDLGDSKRPLLFTQGQDLDLTGDDVLKYLRPRAVTLSAVMRAEHCDLFIHGKGGGVYDQVTERWWHDWTGEDLAPKAVVSADVFLPIDAPTATRDERIQTQWFAHHLPHNIDRYTEAADEVEASLRREKHDLLNHMDDDRDKRRRAKAFQRLHAINAELGALHQKALAQAKRHAENARIGVANRGITRRRDWCFALYPEAQLSALAEQINACFVASPG